MLTFDILTLKQLYLAKNKSWCLLQEENSRERVRKPDDPLYDDQDFIELIRLIKGSNAYSKVCQDKSRTTSLPGFTLDFLTQC